MSLLIEHQDSIRAYIISLLPGCGEASDVLQEANMVIWNKRAQFRIDSNFRAWSFAIARYCVLNHRHKMRRDGRFVFGDELLDQLAHPEEELLPEQLADRREALAACLSELQPEHREIVHNRYSQGKSLEDYALKTKKTAGSLRIKLFRIRSSLRECIDRRLNPNFDLSP